MRLALVPSPFTGAAAWRPLAERLPGAVAMDYGGVRAPDWYEGVAARVAEAMGQGPWIAVLHSGAGGFAPALAEAGAAGLIFADAVRPHPGQSLREVDARFVDYLVARADDGLLPPWNRWFDKDILAQALPDADVRAAFVADLPRTPLAFLEARPPRSDLWETLPAGYLQLSDRYAVQADWAQARGWPVRRLASHHLSMITDVDDIAAAIEVLVHAMVA